MDSKETRDSYIAGLERGASLNDPSMIPLALGIAGWVGFIGMVIWRALS